MSCGVYAVTVDQTIVFWNPAAERILGFTADEVLGQRCYDVIKGHVRNGLAPQCLRGCPSLHYMRAGMVPAASQLHMNCSSGERKWISVSPMVVTGMYKDAPLLVHLFEEGGEGESVSTASDQLRESLAMQGGDVVSDRPSPPGIQESASDLTQRELDVLRLMALGWDTPRIAAELAISLHTVRNHIRNLRQKLGARTKLEAVVAGIRRGILPIDRRPT